MDMTSSHAPSIARTAHATPARPTYRKPKTAAPGPRGEWADAPSTTYGGDFNQKKHSVREISHFSNFSDSAAAADRTRAP